MDDKPKITKYSLNGTTSGISWRADCIKVEGGRYAINNLTTIDAEGPRTRRLGDHSFDTEAEMRAEAESIVEGIAKQRN